MLGGGANALPSVKERADIVLALPRGEGVTQFADQLMEDDLARFDGQLRRHYISLGSRSEDEQRQVLLSPRGGSVLVAGPSHLKIDYKYTTIRTGN